MPRPPKAGGAKVACSLRFDPYKLDTIEAHAARRGLSRQAWVDEAVDAQILREGGATSEPAPPPFPAGPIGVEPAVRQAPRSDLRPSRVRADVVPRWKAGR